MFLESYLLVVGGSVLHIRAKCKEVANGDSVVVVLLFLQCGNDVVPILCEKTETFL